ncbi:MAG: pyridoxamine 5'-phosphate oxidase family protein [Pseudomonadota bacterium]
MKTELTPEDIRAFEPEAKVGLLATVDPHGLPHITLITSLRARTATELMWGQFSEGKSKQHVRDNPKVGFLVLTPDRRLWQGRARWTQTARCGPDFEIFNNLPMFRYNAYLGIHTVHHMALVDTTGQQRLPMAAVVTATVLTRLARLASPSSGGGILSVWARDLFNDLSSLKFLAYVDACGYPRMVPLIQCQARSRDTLVFSAAAFGAELRALRQGVPVAVFGLTLKMESVLVRGPFGGFRPSLFGRMGNIGINWVYNSMPPKQGQIYPAVPLEPIVCFDD